jgi:cytochrome c-type biogenesis protein CcmE
MQRRRRQRLAIVVLGLVMLGAAAALVLTQLQDNIVFFRSPSEVLSGGGAAERRLRLGGLVEENSVARDADGGVRFRVTDLAATVPVTYRGILPDLFREGQGVVVEGRMREGVFIADTVLAKHDENYMPPEVAQALKDSGQWQHMREVLEEQGQIEPADSGGNNSGGGGR